MNQNNRIQRSLQKCRICRARKQKCTPVNRAWPYEKCDYCREHGSACGPNVSSSTSRSRSLGDSRVVKSTPISDKFTEVASSPRSDDGHFPGSPSYSGPKEKWNENLESGFEEVSADDRQSEHSIPRIGKGLKDVSGLGGKLGAGDLPRSWSFEIGSASIRRSLVKAEQFRDVVGYIKQSLRLVDIRRIDLKVTAEQDLRSISAQIAEQRDRLVTKIVASAAKLDATFAGSSLRRALRTLDDNCCHCSRQREENTQSLQLKAEIISKLSKLSDLSNDIPDAESWIRELNLLPPQADELQNYSIAAELAIFFRSTSEKTTSMLEDLDLHKEFKALFPYLKATPVPAIHRALYAGHSKTVGMLSKVGNLMEQRDLAGRTVLHVAAGVQMIDVVEPRQLRKQLEARDIYQMTPLAVACANGHTSIVKKLLRMGADPTCRIGDHPNILSIARAANHADIIKLLQNHGADQTGPSTLNKNRPLDTSNPAILRMEEEPICFDASDAQFEADIAALEMESMTHLSYVEECLFPTLEGFPDEKFSMTVVPTPMSIEVCGSESSDPMGMHMSLPKRRHEYQFVEWSSGK